MKYLEDGTPIPSSMPTSKKRADESTTKFGIYRGQIQRVIYSDDPENLTGERVEYVVKVKGQIYRNAINVRESGGIYNYRERIRKGVEKSISGQLASSTFDELTDGEHVYVMFLEGDGNVPLIVGGAEHPQHGKYQKTKRADGLLDVVEFNGVEVSIDKDSNYMIKQLGRKDPSGTIVNASAVGALIKVGGDGTIDVEDASGSSAKLTNDGNVAVKASVKVTSDAPDTECTGNLKVSGNLHVVGNSQIDGSEAVTGAITAASVAASGNVSGGGTSLSAVKGTFNSHTHTETGTTTSAPGSTL
jgi:hypothetical protein